MKPRDYNHFKNLVRRSVNKLKLVQCSQVKDTLSESIDDLANQTYANLIESDALPVDGKYQFNKLQTAVANAFHELYGREGQQTAYSTGITNLPIKGGLRAEELSIDMVAKHSSADKERVYLALSRCSPTTESIITHVYLRDKDQGGGYDTSTGRSVATSLYKCWELPDGLISNDTDLRRELSKAVEEFRNVFLAVTKRHDEFRSEFQQ